MSSGRKWGGVARRGAGKVDPDKPPPRQQRGRGGQKPPPRDRRDPKELGPPPAWEPEQWIQEPDAEVKPLRKAANKAVKRGAAGKPAARDRPQCRLLFVTLVAGWQAYRLPAVGRGRS